LKNLYRSSGLWFNSKHIKRSEKIDKSITKEDVQRWIEMNTHRRTNLRGYNSYVSPGPKHEYQIDLFFMSDLKNEEYQDYKIAMCAIDSFTKFLTIVPLKSKSES
jgi:hypothetical protein